MSQWGAETWAGNWVLDIEPLLVDESDSGTVTLLDPEGRPYFFIAAINNWSYRTQGPDEVLAFYQPETERVVMVYDVT